MATIRPGYGPFQHTFRSQLSGGSAPAPHVSRLRRVHVLLSRTETCTGAAPLRTRTQRQGPPSRSLPVQSWAHGAKRRISGLVTTFAPPANVILVLAQTADEKGGKPGRTRSHDDRSQTSTSIHTRTRLCQRWRRGLSVCRVPARSAAALKLALSSLNWVPPRLWLRSATTPLPGPLLPLPFARPCGHLGSPPRCMSAPGPRVARGAYEALVPLGLLSVSAACAARSPRLKSEILSQADG